MTAATHGLEDEMARIEEALQPELAAELKAGLQSDAQLLIPPVPILKEDNWPLLTVSKGFFESLAAGGACLSALRNMGMKCKVLRAPLCRPATQVIVAASIWCNSHWVWHTCERGKLALSLHADSGSAYIMDAALHTSNNGSAIVTNSVQHVMLMCESCTRS